MIEAVNFSGYFCHLQSFPTWPGCSFFKKGQEQLSVDLCYWVGASVTKMFQGPAYTFQK